MILKSTTVAACSVLPKARGCAAVHCHLSWEDNDHVNGAVDALCKTIKNVVSSAVQSETAGIHTGGKCACPMITALEEIGHLQPLAGSPLVTDNSTAHGVLNSKMRQKLSKSVNMRSAGG